MQVLRWSALAFGVFYGFSHQRTIYATQQAQHDKHEWDSKQKLIDQAKAEYAKQKKPATSSSGDECTSDLMGTANAQHMQMERRGGLGRKYFLLTLETAIYDPNNPKFDLEKLLEKVSAENP